MLALICFSDMFYLIAPKQGFNIGFYSNLLQIKLGQRSEAKDG